MSLSILFHKAFDVWWSLDLDERNEVERKRDDGRDDLPKQVPILDEKGQEAPDEDVDELQHPGSKEPCQADSICSPPRFDDCRICETGNNLDCCITRKETPYLLHAAQQRCCHCSFHCDCASTKNGLMKCWGQLWNCQLVLIITTHCHNNNSDELPNFDTCIWAKYYETLLSLNRAKL